VAANDVKDRLRESLGSVATRIQESAAFHQLMEKYQSLSQNGQRIALAGSGFLLALLLFLLPWTFYSSSQDHVADFEDKKKMIRDMFRYTHEASTLPRGPEPLASAQLRSIVQGTLAGVRPTLLPEQTAGIEDFDNTLAKSEALPKALTQKGVTVRLSRLNLDQLVTIGTKLKELRPTVKLVGLRVQANQPDPHYFDVSYKLVAFDLPGEMAPKGPPGKPGSKPPPKLGTKPGGE
jgi:hypothetical protein